MMDSNTVLNFEPVGSLAQIPTVTRAPVTIQDHAQAASHQLQINILNENGNNYHDAAQNDDVDSASVDTSVTDSLFPFIDELCLETKNVARFGVKLMSLKIIDKKKFDHIMEETDEYARIYKLYNEAFELNAGKKLIQALHASGNGNVVEFLRQNIGDPTILFDVEEIQQLHHIVQPVQIIQIQPNANFRSPIQSSSSSSAATSAAAATLLLLDSSSHSHNNNIPHRIVQQHHEPESTSVPVAVSIPVTVPSTSITSSSIQNQIHTSHLPDHSHHHQQQQQVLHQFTSAKQQAGLGQIRLEKVEIQSAALAVGSFEDLLHQSLSVSIPQLSPLSVAKEHNSSVTISVDQNTSSIISHSTSVRTSDSTNNASSHNTSSGGSRKFSRNKDSSGTGSARKSNRQKRKKKAVPEEWEKNRNKLLRMQGQEYMGYKKSKDGSSGVEKSILIVRKKRSIGPPCSSPKCLLGKCTSCLKFSQEDREELFQNFWLRMTWEQRKIYVSSLVDVVTVKRHKKDLSEESRRTSSLRYMLKLHGEKQRVCKTMFLSTLGIGDYSVRSWVLKHGGFPSVFSRGGVGHSLRRSQSKLSSSSNNTSSKSSNNSTSTSSLRKKQSQDASNNMSTKVNNNCSPVVPSSSTSSYVLSTNANVNHLRTIECTDISTAGVNTNPTNSGTHFLVKDYFDSLVKMPQEYLHIVQDN